MSFETVAATDIGHNRDHNEDSVFAGTVGDKTVLAVADGMGGHNAGDVASEEGLETFLNYIKNDIGNSDDEADEAIDSLIAGVKHSNEHLQELTNENPKLEGMGTTLIAAVVEKGRAILVNVGDSRAYHVTTDGIEQVTTDQSLVQELVEQGTIEPEAADDHPQKNVLSQALGTDESVQPDTYEVNIEGTILLCSDGLSDEVPEEKIYELVMKADTPEQASKLLIDRANEVDGSDNVSVVLGEIVD